MKRTIISFLSFFIFAGFFSCSREEIDKEKPQIHLNIHDTFPNSCDTLYFGEAFVIRMLFTDNVELGSYSIDIHHNFDHHSHSTEVEDCEPDPVKTPVNPFLFIQDYTIPDGLKEYLTNREITIPFGDDNGPFDEGDYHFFLSLTDKSGWSAQRGISIKMVYR